MQIFQCSYPVPCFLISVHFPLFPRHARNTTRRNTCPLSRPSPKPSARPSPGSVSASLRVVERQSEPRHPVAHSPAFPHESATGSTCRSRSRPPDRLSVSHHRRFWYWTSCTGRDGWTYSVENSVSHSTVSWCCGGLFSLCHCRIGKILGGWLLPRTDLLVRTHAAGG